MRGEHPGSGVFSLGCLVGAEDQVIVDAVQAVDERGHLFWGQRDLVAVLGGHGDLRDADIAETAIALPHLQQIALSPKDSFDLLVEIARELA
jgi:hypothetical protein